LRTDAEHNPFGKQKARDDARPIFQQRVIAFGRPDWCAHRGRKVGKSAGLSKTTASIASNWLISACWLPAFPDNQGAAG